MATAGHPPSFPFSREHAFSPSLLNAQLRHDCPVSKVKLYNGDEAWIIMKHADVKEALDSDKLSADRRAPGYPEIHEGGKKAKDVKPTFVNLDDPDHAKQRNMLEDAFTKSAVEKLRPMMEGVVDKVLDKMVDKYNNDKNKPIDLIEEFAAPVPTQIVYKILGVPESDVDSLSKESEVRTGTSRDAAESANNKLQDYMKDLVQKRISKPKEDLISKLVVEQYKPGNLSEEDIVNLAFLVLTAGNAALINPIGLGVLTLFHHPSQLDELKSNSSLVPQVVNELLRYNTASALNSRRAAKADLSLGNQHIKKGEGVICSVQSADRDEDFTPNAESFDIHRKYDPKEVMGFGYGPHRCQGEWLSRTELEIAFEKLFKKCPNLKLAVDEKDLKYTPATQNMGVLELPVTL